jgi:hypothetical protein
MRRVSEPGARRSEILFGLGNLVPAIVLGVGLFALPTRWLPADLVVGSALLVLVASSAVVFGRPALSRVALRVGARVLLGLGLLLVSVAALSIAFLAGIHGDFGQGGVALMSLIAFLVLPYAVVYPLIELYWVGPVTNKAGPRPATAPAHAASSDDGGAAA